MDVRLTELSVSSWKQLVRYLSVLDQEEDAGLVKDYRELAELLLPELSYAEIATARQKHRNTTEWIITTWKKKKNPRVLDVVEIIRELGRYDILGDLNKLTGRLERTRSTGMLRRRSSSENAVLDLSALIPNRVDSVNVTYYNGQHGVAVPKSCCDGIGGFETAEIHVKEKQELVSSLNDDILTNSEDTAVDIAEVQDSSPVETALDFVRALHARQRLTLNGKSSNSPLITWCNHTESWNDAWDQLYYSIVAL